MFVPELKGRKKNWVVKWDFIVKHPSKKKGFDGKWIMDDALPCPGVNPVEGSPKR